MPPAADSTPVPPRGRRVRETIAQLRQRIMDGEWPVGGRIPTEPQLVEALGVGRNTVREAVRALAHAGVLECRQGSGTYVLSTDELAPVVARRLTDDRMTEVIEVRRAFEVEAARLAARRRTPRTWPPSTPRWRPARRPGAAAGSPSSWPPTPPCTPQWSRRRTTPCSPSCTPRSAPRCAAP
ncbi:hypothetical protein GCM10029963_43650 [Micromonospora andamanensis]